MDARQAREIVKVLIAAYPDKQIKAETVELYTRCVADLPYQLGQAAVLSHITSNKWFPTVAELRAKAMELSPGGRMPAPLEAWGEVMAQIADVGTYGVPQFSHPVIQTTVEAMGWRQLCLSENNMADRAHFMRLYETYSERKRQEFVQLPEVKRLLGELERDEQAQQIGGKLRLLADAKRLPTAE